MTSGLAYYDFVYLKKSEGTASGGGSFSLEDGGDGSKLWLQAAKALR